MILVELVKESKMVSISISDNGVGLQRKETDGLGMKNIRDRVLTLNGSCKFMNIVPSGMAGKIQIPISRQVE